MGNNASVAICLENNIKLADCWKKLPPDLCREIIKFLPGYIRLEFGIKGRMKFNFIPKLNIKFNWNEIRLRNNHDKTLTSFRRWVLWNGLEYISMFSQVKYSQMRCEFKWYEYLAVRQHDGEIFEESGYVQRHYTHQELDDAFPFELYM